MKSIDLKALICDTFKYYQNVVHKYMVLAFNELHADSTGALGLQNLSKDIYKS